MSRRASPGGALARNLALRWREHFGVRLLLLLLSAAVCAAQPANKPRADGPRADVPALLQVLSQDQDVAERGLDYLADNWRPEFYAMAMDLLDMVRDPGVRNRLFAVLKKKAGVKRVGDYDAAWKRLWAADPQLHPDYAEFKSILYGFIDPKFQGYFQTGRTARIRLDEVRWGGVRQDGIPPLRGPKMIAAGEAGYLDDDHVVFGLEIHGDVRAYPQRILAWHEMFVDTVGGIPVAGVYCTLCGTVILYETTFDGVEHELGTSGFLYRSNKLMYDQATQSLWNTIWGEPVIGPLADEGIQLRRRGIVTSTWGEWRRRHPETQVLALDTGYPRDYGEGVAYRDYFATDELMFAVPETDKRLKNKDEVLALVFDADRSRQLALSARYLKKNPVHHDSLAGVDLVVLTDGSGANRVFETRGLRFVQWDGDRTVRDADGGEWTLHEDRLESADGATLRRLPAQRAFWFGWRSSYPDTRLVK